MKKRRNLNGKEIDSLQNPVAKFACRFNKAQTFCDKTAYRRKQKHTKQEVLPIALLSAKPPVVSGTFIPHRLDAIFHTHLRRNRHGYFRRFRGWNRCIGIGRESWRGIDR